MVTPSPPFPAAPPTGDARHSMRNAGLLVAQRVLHVVAAGLFAVFVPRMMGPDLFGRYALLTSVAMWFAMVSGLGAVSLLSRVVPGFTARGDADGLRKLVTSLLVVRGSTAIFTATAYFLLIALAFREQDVVAASFIAGAVLTRTVANLCFALYLGLNRAARWGAGDLLRRWLILLGILIGFPVAGLRGACFGFFVANAVVLLAGLAGAREFVRWEQLDLSRRYLGPFLRTGTAFAAGNLLLALVQRSGETIVRLSTGDYAEVGYYGAAYAIYLTVAQALWQFALALAPYLVVRYQAGAHDEVRAWLERLLKWMLIAASLGVFAVLFVGDDVVPLVLGEAYRPVARNLLPLMLALCSLAVNSVGRLGALTLDRPAVSATAAAVEAAAFWTLGPLLALRAASFGASMAALVASLCYATVITWRLRRTLPYSPRAGLVVIGLALLFAPLAWLRATPAIDAALLLLSWVGFVGLLFRFGVITLEEVTSLRRLVRPPLAGTPPPA
jgi:O-antigen/teichoic acid export membrane protein